MGKKRRRKGWGSNKGQMCTRDAEINLLMSYKKDFAMMFHQNDLNQFKTEVIKGDALSFSATEPKYIS